MALEGEITVVDKCPDCGTKMPIKVCHSAAGYYIGQECPKCGPYNRLSVVYWQFKDIAQLALNTGGWKRRDTEFHGR